MFGSCGGNFPGGSYHGHGFQLIKEHFQQRSCEKCNCNYSPDGIEIIREEPGMVVVRVGCSHCGQPLGIALVSMSAGLGEQSSGVPLRRARDGAPAAEDDIPYPADWTKNDVKRLSGADRISYDDVLDAHEFFSGLGADWHKHLPQKIKRQVKTLSA